MLFSVVFLFSVNEPTGKQGCSFEKTTTPPKKKLPGHSSGYHLPMTAVQKRLSFFFCTCVSLSLTHTASISLLLFLCQRLPVTTQGVQCLSAPGPLLLDPSAPPPAPTSPVMPGPHDQSLDTSLVFVYLALSYLRREGRWKEGGGEYGCCCDVGSQRLSEAAQQTL